MCTRRNNKRGKWFFSEQAATNEMIKRYKKKREKKGELKKLETHHSINGY